MSPDAAPVITPPRLIVLVGLPRSGKSTRATHLARRYGYPVVNPDKIRLAMHGQRYQALAEPFVWAVAHTMVRALMLAGHHTVIIDATNTTRKRRDDWRYPGMVVEFLHVDTAAKDCLMRARLERDEYIVPVIERMAAQWEPLAADELRYVDDTDSVDGRGGADPDRATQSATAGGERRGGKRRGPGADSVGGAGPGRSRPAVGRPQRPPARAHRRR